MSAPVSPGGAEAAAFHAPSSGDMLLDHASTAGAGRQNVKRLPLRASGDARRRGFNVNHQAVTIIADLLRIFDVAVLLFWAYFFHSIFPQTQPDGFWPEYATTTAVAVLFGAIMLTRMNCYKVQALPHAREITRNTLEALLVTFGLVMAFSFFAHTIGSTSRLWFALWFAGSVSVLVSSRLVLATQLKRWSRLGILTERIAIVGAGTVSLRLVERMKAHPWASVDIVGVFDDRIARARELELAVDGNVDDLVARAAELRVDKIIVGLPLSAEHRVMAIVQKLRVLPVDIVLFPDNVGFRLDLRDLDQVAELPVMRVHERPITAWTYLAKTIEDKVIGACLLLLAAPVMAIIALLIKLDSPGPILFAQRRHGFNNREIKVLKFRTMYVDRGDALGARQTSRDDPRVTRIGKYLRRYSLDELPQILNVLRGSMSIVGPRPLPIGMKTENLSCQEIVEEYAGRHRVKPGITGWAQVRGLRGATNTAQELEARIAYDLYYIDNWSIGFDLWIIFITLPKILIFNKDAF